MHQALAPQLYTATSFAITAASITIFNLFGLREEYTFLPVLALAAVYALFYFIRQCRRGGDYHIYGSINPGLLLRRAIARYLVWLVILYGGYQLYLLTPIYSGSQHFPTHRLFADFLYWYLWLGIPYFVLTLTFKASRREDFYDPAIRILHMLKQTILRTRPPRLITILPFQEDS